MCVRACVFQEQQLELHLHCLHVSDRQGMQQTSALSTERLLAAPSEEKNREGWDRISKVAGLKEELSGPTQRSCSDTRFRVRRITCRVLDVNLDLTL